MCPCQLLHIFPTYFNNFTNFVHLPDPPQTPSGTPPGPSGTSPGPSRTPQDPLGPGHRNLFSKNKRESGSSSWHRTRICKRCRWDEGGSLSWHRNHISQRWGKRRGWLTELAQRPIFHKQKRVAPHASTKDQWQAMGLPAP